MSETTEVLDLPTANSRDTKYLDAIVSGNVSDDLPTPITNIDKYLYEIAMNGTGGGGDGTITIDSVLSTSSTHAVQNKAIAKAISEINATIDDLDKCEPIETADIDVLFE